MRIVMPNYFSNPALTTPLSTSTIPTNRRTFSSLIASSLSLANSASNCRSCLRNLSPMGRGNTFKRGGGRGKLSKWTGRIGSRKVGVREVGDEMRQDGKFPGVVEVIRRTRMGFLRQSRPKPRVCISKMYWCILYSLQWKPRRRMQVCQVFRSLKMQDMVPEKIPSIFLPAHAMQKQLIFFQKIYGWELHLMASRQQLFERINNQQACSDCWFVQKACPTLLSCPQDAFIPFSPEKAFLLWVTTWIPAFNHGGGCVIHPGNSLVVLD